VRRGDRPAIYDVGDVVFWGTPTTAGEYTFIGHPKGDHSGETLILAFSGEIGFEVDADECSPTGRSNPSAAESIACDISATIRAGWKAIRNSSRWMSALCHKQTRRLYLEKSTLHPALCNIGLEGTTTAKLRPQIL